MRTLRTIITAVCAALSLALVGCSNSDPLGKGNEGGGDTIVVGSQQYYSNEIIAELYAQSLETAGFTVDRQYQIGQREVYLPELENGKIDVIPEYTGNLLQYYDKEATAADPAKIAEQLGSALPDGLRALAPAEASDQDSYVVTEAFAQEHKLKTIADLKNVNGTVQIGANSELESRPYGPKGLKSVYGVTAAVTPVEDSGGPLTVKALTDGKVQVADIYSSDPAIEKNNLVVLDDPKSLILPQNVVPIVSKKVDDKAAAAIEKVDEALSAEQLRALNAQSVDEEKSSAVIAKDWLQKHAN